MEDKARELLRILNDNGYAAYIVGGYTRDVLPRTKVYGIFLV